MISNYGHVKYYKKDKYLKQSHRKNDNHHIISLRLDDHQKKAKTYSVHRLVAKYFIPNPEGKPQVHHIDGDPNHNHYSNLQWVTSSEHMKLSYMLQQRSKGDCENNPNSKYSTSQFMKLGKMLEENKLSVKELSLKTGISVPVIRGFINKENTWKKVRDEFNIDKYTKLQSIDKVKIELAFKLISENNYTINEIMELTGLSRTSISDIINGNISKKWLYLNEKYDVSKFNNFSKKRHFSR